MYILMSYSINTCTNTQHKEINCAKSTDFYNHGYVYLTFDTIAIWQIFLLNKYSQTFLQNDTLIDNIHPRCSKHRKLTKVFLKYENDQKERNYDK